MTVLPLPVPPETIERQGRRAGIAEEDLADFVEIVMRIDDAYIRREAERAQAEMKNRKA